MRLDHLLSTSLEPLSGILVMRTDALLTFRLAAVLRRLEKQREAFYHSSVAKASGRAGL